LGKASGEAKENGDKGPNEINRIVLLNMSSSSYPERKFRCVKRQGVAKDVSR
jgi:hypothetical protein